MHLINAGESSYPDGWKGYRACCSYDREKWFRVPSRYDADAGRFTITHMPQYGGAYYAYFAPFTCAPFLCPCHAAPVQLRIASVLTCDWVNVAIALHPVTLRMQSCIGPLAKIGRAGVYACHRARHCSPSPPLSRRRYDAHMDLVARAAQSPRVRLEMLGETHDGHDLDLLVFGKEAPEKKKIWIIARQHPGESMAEWFAQGCVDRMTNRCVACALGSCLV
jgi:murein tripeptide amidase MpaA